MSKTNLFELFTEVTTSDQLRPIAWTGEEELCGSFKLQITAQSPNTLGDDVATRLFGQKVTFVAHGPSPLVRRGVIASVAIGGSRHQDYAELAITIVPRLDLMKLRTTSRIFQNQSIVDVLSSLANEWQLPFELKLSRKYSKRKYITQYRETDLDFLRRIASRDGIGFYLEYAELGDEQSKPGFEKLVFFDHAEAYPAIPHGEDPTMGSRLVHDRLAFDSHEHHVTGFRLERRIAPEHVRLGDFDFRKPRLQLRATAAVPAARRSPINTSLGGEQLSVYLHADRAELDVDGGEAEISDALAAIRLQQAQRDAAVARGQSRCLRLFPGSTFTLEEQAEAPSLNQGYVVTKIIHRGRIPETAGNDQVAVAYENAFECVPADVVYRTPLPKLDLRQVTETATVVGPKGGDVHSDEFGRVKVQFHWDAEGDTDGSKSCWLRVLHQWAGANWGSQFIPRVGMEVLVGFLSGDVDQPIVLGSVYNGTHPTPFTLPAEAAKAGFRSQSMPGGDGGSEFTFDDTKGQERMVMRAEKDMLQVVYNDFDLQVGASESIVVDGESKRSVAKDATTKVLGKHTVDVAKESELLIGGSHSLAIGGNLDVRVTGNRTERVEGRELAESFDDIQRIAHKDVTERVLGHKITVVGEHDARRSSTLHVEGSAFQFSTGTTELVSDKEIVLRVGTTSLRLTPDGLDVIADKVRFVSKEVLAQTEETIQLFAKKQIALVAENVDALADKRVNLSGESAQLKLTKEAQLVGSQVKLSSSPQPPDPMEPPEYEPPEVTNIELTDEQGKPMGKRRFILVEGDGAERVGILDEEGKAEVFVEGSCEILFPDVDEARRG